MSLRGNRIIGILREGKNKWERRAPLAPQHVAQLVKDGIKILIQPSTHRAFHDREYTAAGAVVQEDLSPASTILGVKEVPIEHLISDRTYVFFSHTIKAQPYNMGLLDALLAKNIRLMDYECITENGKRNGNRLVAFGRFAGLAGMIDLQRGLGERMLAKGYHNPFLNVASSYMYPNLASAQAAVASCGEQIAANGTPDELGPMVFTFAGDGKVSRGSQEIFQLLPHEMVSVADLDKLVNGGDADLSKVYGCVPETSDFIVPAAGSGVAYSRDKYYAEPDLFRSKFHSCVAPYSSVIVNCVFWTEAFPRLLTKEHMVGLQEQGRLLAIGDVSCDHRGSIECLEEFSTIERPFYLWDAEAGMVDWNLDNHGVLMHAVDTLPAELPIEATTHFGDALTPLIPQLASSDGQLPFTAQAADLPAELHGAIITTNGKLAPPFAYIADLRAQMERAKPVSAGEEGTKRMLMLKGHLFDNQIINKVLDVVEHVDGCQARIADWQVGTSRDSETWAVLELTSAHGEEVANPTQQAVAQIRSLLDALAPISKTVFREMPAECSVGPPVPTAHKAAAGKSVLMLGSGMVCAPVVDLLHQHGVCLTIGSFDMTSAEELAHGRSNIDCKLVDVTTDMGLVEELVQEADVVISLVPAPFHPTIAAHCIKHKRHLVTASYESPTMAAMHQDALDAGISILNEVGLDPGLDHMSAMQIIDEVKDSGGKVRSFRSTCGGLPAPENADNPFGYKFSWNPLGVLTASQNSAKYLMHGETVEVDGNRLLEAALPMGDEFGRSFALEHIPNRDSTKYKGAYSLDDADTVYRGTLRYDGFCEIVAQMTRVGLLDGETMVNNPSQTSWGDHLAGLLDAPDPVSAQDLLYRRVRDSSHNGVKTADTILDAFNFLDLFGNEPMLDISNPTRALDCLCERLQDKLSYGDGERDAVLLHHEFLVENADGTLTRRSSSLKCMGDPYPAGPSAMATTVGVPTGLAALLILDGTIERRGVFIPNKRDVYSPMLDCLADHGITFDEKEINIESL